MSIVKQVWVDKDNIELGIITTILDKYCVPYTVNQKRIVEDIFNVFKPTYRYDITTNLSTEIKSNGKSAYDFVMEKVEERLNLEDLYDSTETEEEFEMRKSIIKAAGDPYKVLNTLKPPTKDGIEKQTKKSKSFLDKIKNWFKPKKSMSILDFCKDFNKKQKTGTFADLGKFINDTAALGKLLSDLDSLCPEANGVDSQLLANAPSCKYDELPEHEKAMLRNRIPEPILRSPKCSIKRVQQGDKVGLMVEVKA